MYSFLINFMGVQLTYNVVLVSAIKQSESVIHISTHFQILFPYRSLESSERVPCAVQVVPISYLFYTYIYIVCVCIYTYSSMYTVSVAQSCPTLCNPMDCSPPGSSVHGVLQARILEWVYVNPNILLHPSPDSHLDNPKFAFYICDSTSVL